MNRSLSFLALLALIAAACERSGDRATEQILERVIAAHGRESKVDIDREHGSISVTILGVTKPADWPSAVPIYPNAKRANIDENRGAARRMSLVTEDTPQELDEFYRGRLEKDGWRLEATAEHAVRARRADELLDLRISPLGREGSRADIEYTRAGAG